ncbi:T9SS type A sorting domain-containing protein [Hymenobacter sp.]|uniref:T9SS type A sorting domain-containing protein n=1 Tax=Hymenobacter sp. TaxID=1898978 RepID=UPI00286CA4E8|nr:T9SS type A sorting domain-containing protein [Hymenobacter sp.]
MKKTLLFLGLLALTNSLHAQTPVNTGPWVEVNLVNPPTFAPGFRVSDVKTVSSTVSWSVIQDNSRGSNPNKYLRTSNAAGDQFSSDAITAPGGAANFQTGNISSVNSTVAVAATYPAAVGVPGGEILRTANGGLSWTKVTTATQFVAGQGGFCNFVHLFDANEGVSFGDPTNGSFEILRTTDAGLTWTRLPASSSPTPLADEAALARSFFARGNTIWVGMASASPTSAVRVLKSTDRGLTWTASTLTTLIGNIQRLAFKDDLNGIAYNVQLNAANTAVTEVNLIRTADGGATWSPITPVNTATGSFFRFDIDAVDGRYYSVGQRFPPATPQAVAADFGSSFSTDGINWTNLNNSQGFFSFDLISGPNATTPVGYAGAASDTVTAEGGIYRYSNTITATRNTALQTQLSSYPNPSHSGVFKVDLGSFLKGGAELTVVDALGRQVLAQTLTATAIGSKNINLDLSREKTGVYTLQIRTDQGIATQKLVID